MSLDTQRVLVVVDASRDVSLSAIEGAIQGLLLKPCDKIFLLGVVHQLTLPIPSPPILPCFCFFPVGYKSKVDSGSILGTNQKFIDEEVERRKEDYQNNEGLKQILQHCKLGKVDFQIDVQSGDSPKVVALRAARNQKATWVILDRHMKKDKKYLMDRLSCGISRMKRNNQVKELRGPIRVTPTRRSISTRSTPLQVTYDEMVEGSTDEESSKKTLTSGTMVKTGDWGSSINEAKSSSSHLKDQETSTNTERDTAEEQSPISGAEVEEKCRRKLFKEVSPESSPVLQSEKYNDWIKGSDELFKNSICLVCNNRRPKIGWTRDFTFAELQAATEGFSPKNFLSEGGFGSVFQGELNGLRIAVKQHKNASSQGEKEFKSEVNVLGNARHENLVMLLGSCSEGNQRLLVYEYVCNGSLDQHLSKHSHRPLSWGKRMKIAMGAARGLQYLHENNIIHRDMRPNNILVTHDFEPLLGDFGLAKTQYEDSDYSSDTRVVGTLGYLAPEYAECGKVSTKTDVYAFGVVLLQLITGLQTTDKELGGRSLVGWARPLLKERNYPALIDHRIIDSHDVHQLFWMVRVAEKCLTKDPRKRLTMDTVVTALTCIMERRSVLYIRDYSPANSDSVGSIPESMDSPCEDNKDDKSFAPTPTANSMLCASIRLPPSPPSGSDCCGGSTACVGTTMTDGNSNE
ncbi:probable serine/threonine-protein kinase PBL10 [Punica granatum]|uniref:Probable serine/threonine-protein kinase PBL10 n=1 Tax=Punica granatum TaxID=22663 RepID=A0A6P8DU51_PUNGR|nr:probable serine/threonine-protein kinase PBL10 [Punica granatum]